MGGGMRQAGYIAAAGLYALENHVDRLGADHAKSRHVADELRAVPYVASVLPVETNIVIFHLADGLSPEAYLRHLAERGIRAGTMGKQTIRFVFHLDVSDDQVDALLAAVRTFH
jgi:threonine aldolase